MNTKIKKNNITRYGFWGMLYIIKCVLYTKLSFKNARLIRLPIDIRGKKRIQVGKNFTTGKYCRIEVLTSDNENTNTPLEKKIIIGDNVQINDNVHLAAMQKLIIGNNVLIASKVFITDHNHGNYNDRNNIAQDNPLIPPLDRALYSFPVTVEDNAWIGEFVSVLPGVTIGKGSIIGTMSVVTKSIPPYSIAAGSPAKVIKQYNFDTASWNAVKH